MRLSRPVAALVLTCALGGLAGCGDDDEPGTGALGPSEEPLPTALVPETASPSVTPTKRPTRTASADGGSGDGEGDDAPATAGGGICADLSAEDVGEVVGATVSGTAIPGSVGCEFRQAGKRGIAVTVLDKSAAEAGGMQGAKGEAVSAIEGEPEDIGGIGSAAFVVTGTMFGGEDVQGAGAVRVGSRIISVFLVQRSALTRAEVRTREVEMLRLIARVRS